jgi:hypothetical protein
LKIQKSEDADSGKSAVAKLTPEELAIRLAQRAYTKEVSAPKRKKPKRHYKAEGAAALNSRKRKILAIQESENARSGMVTMKDGALGLPYIAEDGNIVVEPIHRNEVTLVKNSIYSRYVFNKRYTPKRLWETAIDYFEWVEANPFTENDFKGKDAVEVWVERKRVMTLLGFCIYAGISKRVYTTYSQSHKYIPTCERIDDIIRNQQFEGGAAKLFDSAFIAKSLGMATRTDITSNGQTIQTQIEEMATEELIERARAMKTIEVGEGTKSR